MSLVDPSKIDLAKKIEELHAIANVMALNLVTEYIATNSLSLTQDELDNEVDSTHQKLIKLYAVDRKEFYFKMGEYFHKIKDKPVASLPPSLRHILESADKVSTGGKMLKGATTKIRSRLGEVGKHASAADLGIVPQQSGKTPTSTLGKIASVFKGSQIYDPNTATTPSDKRAMTFDKDSFKKDKEYRLLILKEEKRLLELGLLRTNEERKLLQVIKETKKDFSEKDEDIAKILNSMTVGEKAVYDIAKGLLGAGKGLIGLFKGDKTKKPAPAPTTQTVPAAQVTSAPTTQTVPAAQVTSAPTTDSDVSYVMSNDEVDSAAKEEADEEADENAAEMKEFQERQLEILFDIDKHIQEGNKEKVDDGAGKGFWGTALAGLALFLKGAWEKLSGFAVQAFSFLKNGAQKAGSLIAEGAKKVGSLAKGAVRFLGRHPVATAGLAGYAAGTAIYEGMEEETKETIGGTINTALNFVGLGQDTDDSELKKQIELAQSKSRKRLVEKMEGVESIKREIAPELENKQNVAESAKEKRVAETTAAAVQTVVNAPSNVIVPPAATPRGKDNPRNLDNSLSLYLNSRVKYA